MVNFYQGKTGRDQARAGLIQSWHPAASLESLIGVQESSPLSHSPLLSQDVNRKLAQKQSSRDMNWHPFAMPALADRRLFY